MYMSMTDLWTHRSRRLHRRHGNGFTRFETYRRLKMLPLYKGFVKCVDLWPIWTHISQTKLLINVVLLAFLFLPPPLMINLICYSTICALYCDAHRAGHFWKTPSTKKSIDCFMSWMSGGTINNQELLPKRAMVTNSPQEPGVLHYLINSLQSCTLNNELKWYVGCGGVVNVGNILIVCAHILAFHN